MKEKINENENKILGDNNNYYDHYGTLHDIQGSMCDSTVCAHTIAYNTSAHKQTNQTNQLTN